MDMRKVLVAISVAAAIALGASVPAPGVARASDSPAEGPFRFQPVPSSAICTVSGGDPVKPLVLPEGYEQTVIAAEPQFPDLPDMNTLNETGPDAGRYLYRAHEVRSNGSVSVTDLRTGETRILAQRGDWERLDGIVWSPWGTILTAEETNKAAYLDPDAPEATAGLVYEIDPRTGAAVVRPAVGSRSHEGLQFDAEGNLYGISERGPGYIYKFVPDRRGDLSSGQLYALEITRPTGDRIGEAEWVPLDRDAVRVNSDEAAAAAGATGYSRPEDVEYGAGVLYVAITGEDRVLAVDLRRPRGGSSHGTAFVSEYVRAGLNAPADFDSPDNLVLDKSGNLYIAEDPGSSFSGGKRSGDDIWVATPGKGNTDVAATTVRFASLTDCDAEPTGVYFEVRHHAVRKRPASRWRRQGPRGRDPEEPVVPTPGPTPISPPIARKREAAFSPLRFFVWRFAIFRRASDRQLVASSTARTVNAGSWPVRLDDGEPMFYYRTTLISAWSTRGDGPLGTIRTARAQPAAPGTRGARAGRPTGRDRRRPPLGAGGPGTRPLARRRPVVAQAGEPHVPRAVAGRWSNSHRLSRPGEG